MMILLLFGLLVSLAVTVGFAFAAYSTFSKGGSNRLGALLVLGAILAALMFALFLSLGYGAGMVPWMPMPWHMGGWR